MTSPHTKKNISGERPPIVVVMGHIDHGKSTLLDYIRKTNVVAGESGGITQHISAYEAVHKNKEGVEKKITFLDTPGHEAFSAMRKRGASAADVAILVVSAEDGVKAQTVEAIKAIQAAKLPFLVAVNKIDKPNANPEKVKRELSEHEVYLEGYGGDIPCASVSAKIGTGIPELLDLVLLVAEFAELSGDLDCPAEGFVIESHMDPKRGISASLIITNGVLKKGMCISAGDATAPVRAIENSSGQNVDEASFSSPVLITGLDKIPPAGSLFYSYENRRDAEKSVEAYKQKESRERETIIGNPNAQVSLPIIIKTDVLGTHEAVVHELKKIWHEKANIRIVHAGVGDISENDIKVAAGSEHARIIGFRVGIERKARDAAERLNVPVETFAIIYNILDYIEREVAIRAPKEEVEETRGEARVVRIFSTLRDKQILGGAMLSGIMTLGREVKIVRRSVPIGQGTILELQQQKIKTSEIKDGEFGIMVLSRTEIATGDVLAAFEIVRK